MLKVNDITGSKSQVHRIAIILATLALLFIPGCKAGEGEACGKNSDCRETLVCGKKLRCIDAKVATIDAKVVHRFTQDSGKPLPKEALTAAERRAGLVAVSAVVSMPCLPDKALSFSVVAMTQGKRLRLDVDHGVRKAYKCGSDYYALNIEAKGVSDSLQEVELRVYSPANGDYESYFKAPIVAK